MLLQICVNFHKIAGMILVVFGTRPEFLKIKPLLEELTRRRLEYYTLFTSQHKDIVPKEIPISIVLPEPVDAGNRLLSVLSHTMYNIGVVLTANPQIKYVLVQGDTTSALAGALAAMNCKVKVIHLEAGLRTYDGENPYPEEYNRQIISRITDIHLCPTTKNKSNLEEEKAEGKKFVVGNTILDTLVELRDKVGYTNKVLVTLHRRENHDKIDRWFKEINRLARIYNDYEFILPLHPNPNVQKHKDILTDVKVVNPLSHGEFLELLAKCRMVISDSGGVQEECSFLKKKVIVCRKITERPESIGTTSIMCAEPEKVVSLFSLHDYDIAVKDVPCPYGDGTSSQQIAEIFEQEIYNA